MILKRKAILVEASQSGVDALVGGGVLLLGSDPRAFYVLAVWAVSGFVLIVWNAWVLMSEVGN